MNRKPQTCVKMSRRLDFAPFVKGDRLPTKSEEGDFYPEFRSSHRARYAAIILLPNITKRGRLRPLSVTFYFKASIYCVAAIAATEPSAHAVVT